MASTFSYTITAVDKVSAVVNGISASIDKMTAPIRKVQQSVGRLNASLGQLARSTGLDKIGRGLWRLGAAATEAARRMMSMVPILGAITGVGIVAGVAALTRSFGNAANEISSTSFSLGVSTKELQKWEGASRLAGLAAGSAGQALKSVGQVFEDSVLGRNNEAAQVMQQYGIQVHRLKNGSIDAGRALEDISRVAGGMHNAQYREKFLGVFGLQGMDALLGKGLPQLRAKLQEAQKRGGQSDEQIQAGERYNTQLAQLALSAEKFKGVMAAGLAPSLERVVELVDRLTQKYGEQVASKIAEYVERIANWIDKTDWAKVARDVGEFVDRIGGVEGIAVALAAITFAGPISAAVTLAAALASVTLGVMKLSTVAVPALAKAGEKILPRVGANAGWFGRALPFAAGAYLALRPTELGDDQQILRDLESGKTKYAYQPTGTGRMVPGPDGKMVYQYTEDGEPDSASKARFDELESKYGLPSGVLDSMWLQESGRGKNMLSSAGAEGHFQAMPDTAKEWGLKDPYDFNESSDFAARYMQWLLKQTGGNLSEALAAYNGGIGNLKSKGLERMPAESQRYHAQVMARLPQAHAMSPTATPPRKVAVADPANGSASGGAGQGNKVDLNLTIHGAPPGTTASVSTSGNTSARIAQSGLTDAPL